jgi:uncharacterized membrane protein (UPF0127 family)
MLRRMRGLMGRRTLDNGEGMLLAPCNGIHMFFMRVPLDVVFLNRHNQVVCTVSGLPIGALVPRIPGAVSVVEVPVGTVCESGTTVGDLLSIEPAGDSTVGSGVAWGLCSGERPPF